jgi:hypothetical protein
LGGCFYFYVEPLATAADALDDGPTVLPFLDDDRTAAAGVDANAVVALPMPIAVATGADTNVHAASLAAVPPGHVPTIATAPLTTTLAAVTVTALTTLARRAAPFAAWGRL